MRKDEVKKVVMTLMMIMNLILNQAMELLLMIWLMSHR